jgi:DNA invertase Pin-like site-specific DNA recombinase
MADRAVIYARYSSDNQRDASIDQQVKACEQYARDQRMEIVRIYADRALTGKTDKRPDFLRMIRDSARQDFQFVIVYSLDRFSRNKYDSAIYKQKLKENGVRVLSAMEHITDDPTGVLMESILEGFAQYYSDELSQKIHRGLKDNAEKAIVNGSVPLGYRRGADGHAEIVPEEAETVREIFRRVSEGEVLIRIIEDLNRRGITTKRGGLWNKSSFNKLLSNERYIGVYTYKETRIEGGFPSIVDKELFDSVQTHVQAKPNARGGTKRRKCKADTYLLTGKLYCGECDSPMSGISGKSQADEPYHYYICTKKRYEKACHKHNVRRDEIERQITQEMRNLLDDDELLEWMADQAVAHLESERDTAELEDVRAKLKEATRKRDKLLDALEDEDMVSLIKDRLKARQEEVKDLERRLRILEADNEITISRDMILSYLEMLRDGDVEDRAYQEMLIDTFLIRAYVFDDGRLKLIFNYQKEHREVTIALEDFSRKEGAEDCGEVRLSSSHLHQSGRRRTVAVYMVKGYFVCDISFAG